MRKKMNETKNLGEKSKDIFPGLMIALIIALIARWIEAILPVDFIGATVIAIILGIIINNLYSIKETTFNSGVTFTSKRVLKFAIILLGGSLNIATILEVGQVTLIVLIFTLLTAFGGGYLLGKLMGVDWKFSSLISAGTGICGGTAISAVAPIIDAEDSQVSYAMSNIFIFDMFMIILFPLIGGWLGMSDMSYGLWAGTAVNDTSSVVAAGYAFSETAGDFATMVKLTRTLAIIPVVIGFSLFQMRKNRKQAGDTQNNQVDMNLKNIFPWFIVGFLALVALNSIGLIPVAVSQAFKDISKFLMIVALAAIGLKTDLGEMKQTGIKPLIHGVSTSVLVVLVSLAVQYMLNILYTDLLHPWN